ncbi:MAG: ABC transporter permease [Flexilinea sp.]
MEDNKRHIRTIGLDETHTFKKTFIRWDWMLVVLFIAINIMNSQLSKNYLNYNNLANTCKIFLDKGIVAIPMMMVLLIGEIDISVASIITLSSVIMGLVGETGAPLFVVILSGLAAGLLCGLFNGVLIAKFTELSSTIITLANLIFFRGIAYMILENRAYSTFPAGMKFFGWGSVGRVPFILILFFVEALIFAYLIHYTKFGRSLYAIGRNSTTSFYSGINTDRIKIAVFAINGLFSAIAGVFLVSKLGSARASMATGYEMEIIAMTILGGISVAGGVGNVIGVVLSVFIIGLLRFGLGLVNISAESIMIIIGSLLIVTVAIPNLKQFMNESMIMSVINRRKKMKNTEQSDD